MVPDLVSVVICCYNNWPDLELAIQSALHQSYRPVEVIVVDNSSSDATPIEVPRRFGDLIRYIRQPNVGNPGGGYNTGMRLANGEFVQFLDGDDFLASDKIEKQIDLFRANPGIDIMYGDVRYFRCLPDGVWEWKDEDMKGHDDILAALLTPDHSRLSSQTMLYRRTALDRVGDWDETLYIVDLDYWLRAAWAGCRFQYCPGSLAFYRRHPGQMSSYRAAMLRGFEAVWSKALGYITLEPYRGEIWVQLARMRFLMAFYVSELTTREALAMLAEARATNPAAISMLVYALACALIILPGGRRMLQHRWIRPLSIRVARFLSSKL